MLISNAEVCIADSHRDKRHFEICETGKSDQSEAVGQGQNYQSGVWSAHLVLADTPS